MKKQLLLILVITLIGLPATAQQRTTTLRGSVVDQANNAPLTGALILIDGGIRHSTANVQGDFTVTGVPRQDSILVEISFLGYATVSRTLNTNQNSVNLGTIKLREEGNLLESVTVSAASNIAIQKGDTTQFNASAFKTNPDADAGDLINKLPGATVEEGSVTIQGETVARAYVDGKLFFGDDVMTAMRNLPADAIESIQMFDELTDEAKFAGFDDGNRQRSLNIVTKHKMKRSTTGRIEAGYGSELDKDMNGDYQDRYLVSGTFNTFTDKNRWSLNGTANNMNRANNSEGFQGGGGGGMRGGGLRTINSIGLNYSGTWTPQLKFNSSYSYNQNQNTSDSWTTRDYYTGDRFERDTTYGKSTANTHRANIRLEYEGPKDRIFFLSNGSFRKNDSWENAISSSWITEALSSETKTATNKNNDSYSFGGRLMWTHKLGQKLGRTFTLGVNGDVSDNDADEHRLQDFMDAASTHIYTLTDVWSRDIEGRVSYTEPLGAKGRLMFTYRLSYDNSKSIIEAWDQQTHTLDESLSNTYSRNYLRNTGGVGYSFSSDKYRISTGLDYRSSALQKEQLFPEVSDYDRTFVSWEPYANMRYMLNKSKYFELRYTGRSSLPSVEQLQNVITVSNTTLTAGNPDLMQSYTHSVNLRYNTANVEKSTNFWTFIDARLTRNSVSYRTRFFDKETVLPEYGNYVAQAGSRLRTPVNMNGAASLRSMAGYSFTFRPLRININLMGGYNYTRSPSYTQATANTQALLNYSNAHGGNFRIGFVSNISENVDFDISSFTSFSYVLNTAMENRTTWNESVTGRLNVIFLGGFTYNTDFSWRYSQSDSERSTTTNSYIWNMGIGRKFLKRRQAEFRLTLYDILNQSQNMPRYSEQADNLQQSWSRSMGRYVLASVSFRFNSMNTGSASQAGNRERRDFDRPSGPPSGGGRGGLPGGGIRMH